MRWSLILFPVVFVIAFIGFLYMFAYLFPVQSPIEQYEAFVSNVSYNLSLKSEQFYPRMRYTSNEISYTLESACDEEKEASILEALLILEDSTILKFTNSEDGEISFLCSEVGPSAENEDHFVAGEGGPTKIINASRYSLINEGQVSLYRNEKCDTPIVALHETLHALGFDHTNNKTSIMFPVTDCKQTLDSQIIEEINSLYSEASAPDMFIEKLIFGTTGKYIQYLNFNITLMNQGLLPAEEVNVTIRNELEEIGEFSLKNFNSGQKKTMSVQNIKLPRKTKVLEFTIKQKAQDSNPKNDNVFVNLDNN